MGMLLFGGYTSNVVGCYDLVRLRLSMMEFRTLLTVTRFACKRNISTLRLFRHVMVHLINPLI